jgi:hypothetical protein
MNKQALKKNGASDDSLSQCSVMALSQRLARASGNAIRTASIFR